MFQSAHDPQNSYDQIAEEYAEKNFHELDHKPKDRELLDRLAADTQSLGPICDMGCGPGEVARYLKDRGADALGMDISPKMIETAQKLSPDIPFRQGDMMSLDVADNTWGGIAAFYSIIHIPRKKIVDALRELKRVLKPSGLLLVAIHLGSETLHLEEWSGKKVSMDFYFFTADEMRGYLIEAGFSVEEVVERPPYPDVEYQGSRAYLFARKPAQG
jgi:ubiquinone/menaquinone biosynthesis C-methylase UbiE